MLTMSLKPLGEKPLQIASFDSDNVAKLCESGEHDKYDKQVNFNKSEVELASMLVR